MQPRGKVPHAVGVLGPIRVRVEVARAVVARLLEQLHQEEERLDRFRAEAQILIEAARLLIVQVDVEQLAGLERLRDGVVEVQARHVLVRHFRIDADHLRMRERGDEPEIRRGGREVDVAARLVRLGFEREAQVVSLVARVLAQEVDRVAEALDRLDRDPCRRRLPRPRARPRTRRCARPAPRPDPSRASSSARRRRGPAGRAT